MIQERQTVVDKVERHDLLSSLLKANDHGLDLETLSENEIISMFYLASFIINVDSRCPQGNIYVFLFTGHEVRNLHLHFTFF